MPAGQAQGQALAKGQTQDQGSRLEAALGSLLASLESPHSRRAYRYDWVRFTAWLSSVGVNVLDARPSDIQNYVLYMQQTAKAKATRGRALAVIREIYGAFTIADLCLMNPAREVKNPRLDNTPKTPWLSLDGIQQLLSPGAGVTWKERRDRLCLLLFIGLGWRRSEIAAIDVDDLQDSMIRGTFKGAKVRTVGVPQWLLAEIADWRAFAGINAGALLPRSIKNHQAVSGDIVYKIIKKLVAKTGVPSNIAPHALRRTFITILRSKGADLHDLQLAVSHSSITTTELYDRAAQAAENAPGEMFATMVAESKQRQ